MKTKTIKWKDKLKEWKTGIPQKYPSNITKRFFYRTSVCNAKKTNKYIETYTESNSLEALTQNYKPFEKHLITPKNKYVTSFVNLTGDSILIIPTPIKDKDYTTMKDFVDNAPLEQQQELWKHVAECAEKMLTIVDEIYINTHGLGVSYLHVRLDTTPKYY